MTSTPPSDVDVDLDRLERLVAQQPVRLAVLFGSYARGTETSDSDVDVAVAFEDDLSAQERLERRIDLVVDLVRELGTDDVDVADLEEMRPAVGASALRTGIVLVGERAQAETYLARFEDDLPAEMDETHEDRMRRFDSIIDRLEGRV